MHARQSKHSLRPPRRRRFARLRRCTRADRSQALGWITAPSPRRALGSTPATGRATGLSSCDTSSEDEIRIVRDEAGALGERERVGVEDHRAGAGTTQFCLVSATIVEADVFAAGARKARHAVNPDERIAPNLDTEAGRRALPADNPDRPSRAASRRYLPAGRVSSSALMTRSVMSIRGLAHTASWKMMSYRSASAIRRTA